MRRIFPIIITYFIYSQFAFCQNTNKKDSILNLIMQTAEKYEKTVDSFHAEIYMRSYSETIKKNKLYKYLQFIPKFLLYDPTKQEGFIETFSTLEYRYPKNYLHRIKFVGGSFSPNENLNKIPYDLLNINVYSEAGYSDLFIMPTRKKGSKNYIYTIYPIDTLNNNQKLIKVYFRPKYLTTKLLKGSFTVEENTWCILDFYGEGIEINDRFAFHIKMQNENYKLPTYFSLSRTSSYLGNVITNQYLADIKYLDFSYSFKPSSKKVLNLSRFEFLNDTVTILKDNEYWSENRKIPLRNREKEILNKNSIELNDKLRTKVDTTINWANLKRVITNSNYKYKSTRINYSGILNPFMIGYSSFDGITYRQKASFDFASKSNQDFNLSLFAGYMFKRKELFTDMSIKWLFKPDKLGYLKLSAGNGNSTYSSLFIKQVQDSLLYSGLKFEDISVDYYKDYYINAYGEYEYFNGLKAGLGVNYHIRKGSKKQDLISNTSEDGINDMFGEKFTFEPYFRIIWTPEQYYKMIGNRKIPLYSDYPIFKLEVAKALEDVLLGSSKYIRFEMDVSQRIPLGMLQSIQYHFGGGLLDELGTEYFADFAYFSQNNFPENWDDGIGGNFALLRRNFYNASNSYLQFHGMFETPFLVLNKIPLLARGIAKERIYFSQLYTPEIKSYTELGYGIGNRIANVALFFSFHKTKFQEIGLRAALAL